MKVTALGSNGRYQLGLLHNEDASKPQDISIPCHSQIVVKQIANGGNHTLLLTDQGELYGAGLNTSGQLGFIRNANMQVGFTKVNVPATQPRFGIVEGGWEYSVLVDNNGSVYTCGTGSKGELGLGEGVINSIFPPRDNGTDHTVTYRLIESFPPPGTKIKDVRCGVNHTVVLLSDDTVWGWGASRHGQLGETSDSIIWKPRLVFSSKDSDSPIIHISCGRQYTVLGSSSSVYVLGSDKFGVRSNIPQITDPIRYVGSGWSSIHVHLESGRVLSWGNDSHGQLIPDSGRMFSTISVGSEHVLAVDESGHKVFAWGWGEHGNCGESGLKSDKQISLIWESTSIIKDIFAGQANGWIVE
jgi:protein ATS1